MRDIETDRTTREDGVERDRLAIEPRLGDFEVDRVFPGVFS
jgi:hypothetical protein